jgi:hypothetical protein
MLARFTQDELNTGAVALGIVDAASLPTKDHVIEAIALQQEARMRASAARSAEYEVFYESRRQTATPHGRRGARGRPRWALVGFAWRTKTRQTARIVQR